MWRRAGTAALVTLVAGGCGGPSTDVKIENGYPATSSTPMVVYDAFWQGVSFAGDNVVPGASSAPQPAVPTSGDTAYVVLAPGWNPSGSAPPSSFVVLESRSTFSLQLGNTLTIPVDDSTFAGNCAAGSHLTQDEAMLITQRVFPGDFASVTYDPSTCTLAPIDDAGVEAGASADAGAP